MLLYRLRDRIFEFKDGSKPHYPDEAVVKVALAPQVPFGGVSGVTRQAVTDTEVKARANLSTGRFVLEWDKPLFDPVTASVRVADTTFEINGNVVTVRSRCTSQQDLHDLLSAVFYAFPAVLNVYFPDAPFPTHAWGQIGSARFNWIFEPTEVRSSTTVTSKGNQERLTTDSWRYVAVVAETPRLMAGLYYFHVACRLLEAGNNRFEFMAEALLNCAKCLQSLFGQSRDDVREQLTRLGKYSEAEIEGKFMPAMVLRDEFDIAHVSLATLEREHLRVLHAYTHLTEPVFRDLLGTILTKILSGEYTLPDDTPRSLTRSKERIISRLANNIAPFRD